MAQEKEYLYVGHYIDDEGNYVLKIGTTNNLERRRKEHNSKYKKTPNHPFGEDEEFNYDWSIPLSKWNTLRYEEENKQYWKDEDFGEYIRNDRFVCKEKPTVINVKIRKIYEIYL